jgi:tetratricopeptide (TPR) repeat protein
MDLASAYRKLADALWHTRDPKWEELRDRAIRIWESLAAAHPKNRKVQSSLAVGYWEQYRAHVAREDYRAALPPIRRSVAVAERLVRSEPGNARWLYNLALYLKYEAGLREKTGDPAGAIALCDRAIALDQGRCDRDPNDASALLDLSFSYGARAGALEELGNTVQALDALRKALGLRERLAAEDPKNARYRHAVFEGRYRMGWLEHVAGDDAAALATLNASVRECEVLSQADLQNASLRAEIARILEPIALVERSIAERAGTTERARKEGWLRARGAYGRAAEVLRSLDAEGKLTPEFCTLLDQVVGGIADCDAALARRG